VGPVEKQNMRKLKKLIKKAVLLFPPVKRLKRRMDDMRRQIEELHNQINVLQDQNEKLSVNLQNTSAYTGFLEGQLNSAIDVKKVCPICGNEFWVFLSGGTFGTRKNASCPYCGSLERHRALYLFFRKQTDLFDRNESSLPVSILHFAPEPCLYEKIRNIANLDYFPVDFDSSVQGIRDVIDIQNVKYGDGIFDIIICNHVLEHIPDDHAAMRELNRILKQEGTAYINTPVDYSRDVTLENPEYNTPELRTRYYGQFDHVRYYGNDYVSKLEDAGFSVRVIEPNKDFNENEISRYGLLKDEKIYECKKR
jgi:SAM-dependent methyltransferase